MFIERRLLVHLLAMGDDMKQRAKTKGFTNLNFEATNVQLLKFAELYAELTSHVHMKTVVANYKIIDDEV